MNIYTEIFNNLSLGYVIPHFVFLNILIFSLRILPYGLTSILKNYEKFENFAKKIDEKLDRFWNSWDKLTNYSIFKSYILPSLLILIICYLLLIFFQNPLICQYIELQIEGFNWTECRDYFRYLHNSK